MPRHAIDDPTPQTDRDPPPTLCALWRDRDIIGPLLGLLIVGVVLRDLAHRLTPRSR